MKLTENQTRKLLKFFELNNILLVSLEKIGDVKLPEINKEFVIECLEEGI